METITNVEPTSAAVISCDLGIDFASVAGAFGTGYEFVGVGRPAMTHAPKQHKQALLAWAARVRDIGSPPWTPPV